MTISNADLAIVQHIQADDSSYEIKQPTPEVDYHQRFVDLDQYLNEHVHPRVTAGAAASDQVWLTDHGPGHIRTVLKRTGDLSFKEGRCVLSPYEAYLLAVGTHFHDIGNVFGRDQHEATAVAIMAELPDSLIGNDSIEKRIIRDIAKAHGGFAKLCGDKDTIGQLSTDPPYVRSLAAILRFADELADDHTRTHDIDRIVMQANPKLRQASHVYHVYAHHLKRVTVDHSTRSVLLTFEVLDDVLRERFDKAGQKVYLLDEIFKRTAKMHREQIYCDRFMRPHVMTERVQVTITICREKFHKVLGKIPYVLEQHGYPAEEKNIAKIAPDLAGITGAVVRRHIKSLQVNSDEHNIIPEIRQRNSAKGT